MMLPTLTLVSAAIFSGSVFSFPESFSRLALAKRQVQGRGALPLIPPPYSAKDQYVDNKGVHAFMAPGPGDERGPCPGLNAMANHGYIPRNGIATVSQFIEGWYGALFDGDGTKWSIGGVPRTGISGSNGNYESDSSALKSDLNQYGSNQRVIMSQFYNLYNRQPNAATANYNMEILRAFRGDRFQESINKNPWFWYAPIAGIQVTQAGFIFIYRFMANKTAQNPEGILNKEVLKSFMSISGPENNLQWTFGREAIPNNWYKRNPAAEYTIPYFQADIGYFAQTQPQILEVGCNQGQVNTYNRFSPEVLTGGAYNASLVAAQPLCFAAAWAAAQAANMTGLPQGAVSQLNSALSNIGKTLGSSCRAITSLNTSPLSVCPGFRMYGGPNGTVAPGAIQS